MTKVRYSYLPQQFNNCPELWKNLKKFVIYLNSLVKV